MTNTAIPENPQLRKTCCKLVAYAFPELFMYTSKNPWEEVATNFSTLTAPNLNKQRHHLKYNLVQSKFTHKISLSQLAQRNTQIMLGPNDKLSHFIKQILQQHSNLSGIKIATDLYDLLNKTLAQNARQTTAAK